MSAVPEGESLDSVSFRDLGLSEPVLKALADVGYESPSPIQAATIPVLLSGADMLGQAQTGTGKTAAFALPALSRIDLSLHEPQVLVLVPTRELALQVAEAFQRYAAHLKGFHVLPIYGGQSYQPQLNALRRGVHVVVGTPGRVIDHMNRGTLKLTGLTMLVLDEADEMLRMGFVDAVESILEQTPPKRQVTLFSATIPAPIRRIAPEAFALAGRSDHQEQDQYRKQHPSALLGRQRHAQARRTDAHSGSRNLRRYAGVHAHQAIDRRACRKARGARLCSRAAQRRYPATPARTHGRAIEGRTNRHRRRHRCGRTRTRRRAHRPCGELRRAV